MAKCNSSWFHLLSWEMMENIHLEIEQVWGTEWTCSIWDILMFRYP